MNKITIVTIWYGHIPIFIDQSWLPLRNGNRACINTISMTTPIINGKFIVSSVYALRFLCCEQFVHNKGNATHTQSTVKYALETICLVIKNLFSAELIAQCIFTNPCIWNWCMVNRHYQRIQTTLYGWRSQIMQFDFIYNQMYIFFNLIDAITSCAWMLFREMYSLFSPIE